MFKDSPLDINSSANSFTEWSDDKSRCMKSTVNKTSYLANNN